MKDLRDKDIIGEYLVYVDENYNKCKGNAYRYEASDSLLRYPNIMAQLSRQKFDIFIMN